MIEGKDICFLVGRLLPSLHWSVLSWRLQGDPLQISGVPSLAAWFTLPGRPSGFFLPALCPGNSPESPLMQSSSSLCFPSIYKLLACAACYPVYKTPFSIYFVPINSQNTILLNLVKQSVTGHAFMFCFVRWTIHRYYHVSSHDNRSQSCLKGRKESSVGASYTLWVLP